MLNKLRKLINTKIVELELHKQTEQQHIRLLNKLNKEAIIIQEAREIFQKAAIMTQNHLAVHLSTIVTNAVRTVFYDKDVSFKVEFVERRNVTECDMWFEENGHKFSLLESRGFGMTDIASFALRVAYILLHESDNVLIIDEPFRNLSEDRHEVTSQMIKTLSEELKIQFIISTHVTSLKEYADKSFYVTQKNNISSCH